MAATYSSTSSTSYTETDVEKVILNVKADLLMIADSSKAMSRELAMDYSHDIQLAVKHGYLEKVDVTLIDQSGGEKRAITYLFTTGDDASGHARPGGVRWPETSSGHIRIVLLTNDSWDQEQNKISRLPWKMNWVTTSSFDTDHSTLKSSGSRGYSSNGFGANRNDYS